MFERILSLPKWFKVVFFLSVAILCSTVGIIIGETSFLFNNKIHDKIIVGNIAVGGLSSAQAKEKINTAFQKETKIPPLTAIYQDKKWSIDAKSIDLDIDAAKLAKEAYDIGRTGSVTSKIAELYYISFDKTVKLPLAVHYDQNKLYMVLADIARTIDRDPKDGQIKVNGDNIEVIPHLSGLKVDLTKTMADVAANFSNKFVFSFNITVNEVSPQILTSYLSNIDGLLSSYTTYFNPYDKNRTQNIIISAQKINNILIKPSEIFSFNTRVGLRRAEDGYLEAPVYINGVLVPDWGGGVCQVSSTLYNAVLLSGLKIEERMSHFRPPDYVPLGQDATVADNLIDLKFKNTLSQNIYITSLVGANKITVSIYGKRLTDAPEFYIATRSLKKIEHKIITKPDPDLPLGEKKIEEEGADGLVVSTYRIKKINGKIVNREFLATDEFIPVHRIELLGTKIEKPANSSPQPKQPSKPEQPKQREQLAPPAPHVPAKPQLPVRQ